MATWRPEILRPELGYGQDDMGFDCQQEQEMSLLQKHYLLALVCTQLLICWIMGVLFPWVNIWGVKMMV
jgi:hypothetical protein